MMIPQEARERLALWAHLVVYEVRKSYIGSALGLLWAVIEPLLFLATYVFLFVVILKVGGDGRSGAEMTIMMFAGLVPWLYFANTISRGMSLLSAHATLVKQINFPIGLLPFVTVAQVTVEFLISLALLLGLAWAAGYLAVANLLLIPAVIVFALFLVAVSTVVSCYTVMLPDLQKLLPTALRIGIFITPVLYMPAAMVDKVRLLAYANPIGYFISPFRYAVLQDPEVFIVGMWQDLTVCCGLTAVMVVIAFLHRDYVRSTVVDYL